jgi:predicted acetyltransferase
VLENSHPLNKVLDNGLILKSISTEEEIERLADFNIYIHEEDVLAGMTRALIRHHPSTHSNEWLFVEDPKNGKIVSALCLIPWTLRYDSVTLKSAEMGIVGTLPEYRHQGLVRSLNEHFEELLDSDKYHLSHIQGIPYYYRQFGYEYALPLIGGWDLEFHDSPSNLPPMTEEFTFQKARVDDIHVLEQLHNNTMNKLDISAVRDVDIWNYLLTQADNLSELQETWLVQDKNNDTIGYVRIAQQGFAQGLIVDEASYLSYDAAIAVLYWLKKMGQEKHKPNIRLSMSDTSSLMTIAKAWGAKYRKRYAWQVKVPNPARLLQQIVPVLEQRIKNSPFENLTRSLIINLYREGYELVFENGQIITVNTLGFCEDAYEVRIPPNQFTQLVLGYRSCEELRDIYPDVSITGQAQPLIDVLFPKMESFLYILY